jgi:AcrR family transcriptional regulator
MTKNLQRIATMHRMQVKGLELFYKQGYFNTSIDDILKSLELSKGAFYHHFKSKEDFFINIIQNLITQKVYGMLIEPLEEESEPLTAICNCFENALLTAENNELDHGFVLSNFMTEFNGRNPEIMKYLKDLYKIWEVNLVNILQKGKLNGALERHVDVEGLATYLISSFIGIRTLMVEGNARLLRYNYMQQLRGFIRVLSPLTCAV